MGDREIPPPGVVVDQCPSDTCWPPGWRARLIATDEQVAYAATQEDVIAAAWAERRRVLDAWQVGAVEAEAASLRERLASLGDQYKAERAARQALLYTANDLRENVILELEHATGKRATPKRVEALVESLRPALEAQDWKLKTWGPRAAMRLAFGRSLAAQALQDALDRVKGTVRHG